MIKNYLFAAMLALPLVFTSSVALAKNHDQDKKHQVHEKKSSHKKPEKKQQATKKRQHIAKQAESKQVKAKAKDKHTCIKNCVKKEAHVENKKVVPPTPAAHNEPQTKPLAPLPELPKIDTPDSSMGKLIDQSATDAKQDARQKLSTP